MHLTFNRKSFLAAFQTAAPFVPTRSPKPILTNVKLEAAGNSVLLLATDLELAIRVQVDDVDVKSGGSAILPSGRFGTILRESTDETLELKTDQSQIIITGQRSQFKMPSEDPQDFPAIPVFPDGDHSVVGSAAFRQLIKRTIFATETESSRYALGGVLLEFSDRLIGVGTDGRRLAKTEIAARSIGSFDGSQLGHIIVPAKALQLIERALGDGDCDVKIAAKSNEILIQDSRATIYSRLVEGRFPKWRDVFPTRTGTVSVGVPAGLLHSAIRQAAIVTTEESRGMDFNFQSGNLIMGAHAADRGQSRVELPIDFDGQETSITLDPRYLADFLKVLAPETIVTIELKGAENAAVCTTDDSYGYVIMPLARDR
jgi:DNA polymerase III subunit beta